MNIIGIMLSLFKVASLFILLIACVEIASSRSSSGHLGRIRRAKDDVVYIDIHVPVVGNALDRVIHANKELNEALESTEVDFMTKDTPHVTLYLTAFMCPAVPNTWAGACVDKVKKAVAEALPLFAKKKCSVELSDLYAAGTYAMWNVSKNDCLQYFSDTIVNMTYMLSEPNQTAPSWIHSLPEPERSEKLRDVALYGSPNVFSQFQPHVTVAWDSDADAVSSAIEALDVNRTSFVIDEIALGSVGVHGTVLKGKDYAVFPLSISTGAQF